VIKNIARLLAVPAALFIGSSYALAEEAAPAAEPEGPVSVSLNVDFASAYLFRGQNLYNDIGVEPTFEVGYDMGDCGALTASTWHHYSAGGADSTADKFTEWDFTLAYEKSFDILTLSAGNNWYTYPDDDDAITDTAEFFVGVSLDTLLTPSLTYIHDYRDFDYNVFELGFSQLIENGYLGEGFNATPSVVFGFASNGDKVYADNSGLMYVETGVGFNLKLGDIDVTPSVNYSFKVDDNTNNEFWIKVGFGHGWNF
jgi:hypothetical protein